MSRAVLAALALILACPLAARAQPGEAHAPVAAAASPEETGEYTLKQREDWLTGRIEKAKETGSIDPAEAERVGHEIDKLKQDEEHARAAGQLTDAQTVALETRLDEVADKIHWVHENGFWRPW